MRIVNFRQKENGKVFPAIQFTGENFQEMFDFCPTAWRADRYGGRKNLILKAGDYWKECNPGEWVWKDSEDNCHVVAHLSGVEIVSADTQPAPAAAPNRTSTAAPKNPAREFFIKFRMLAQLFRQVCSADVVYDLIDALSKEYTIRSLEGSLPVRSGFYWEDFLEMRLSAGRTEKHELGAIYDKAYLSSVFAELLKLIQE